MLNKYKLCFVGVSNLVLGVIFLELRELYNIGITLIIIGLLIEKGTE